MNDDRYGLFSINNNPNSDFDIIFIHGLGGDKYTTWENENGESWQNWLAQDYNASVWSIAYGANKTNWIEDDMSLDKTADFMLGTLKNKGIGKKPYMFVVHSLGGLLVKKILLKANVYGEYKELSDMCKSIVFFAVPHTGSGWANLLNYAKPLLRNSSLLTALPKGSDGLHALTMEFNAHIIQNNIETNVFYETKELRAKGILDWLHLKKGIVIVSQDSATKVHSLNQNIPLPEDHISICKISSRESDTYANKVKPIMNNMIEVAKGFKAKQEEQTKSKIETDEATEVVQNHSGEGDNVVNKTVINKSVSVGGSSSGIIITGDNNIVG